MKPEHAFSSCAFPCNSKPFVDRLREIIESAGTNSLEDLLGADRDAARGCMWVLMAQLYGQMATIDLNKEWDFLNEQLEASHSG